MTTALILLDKFAYFTSQLKVCVVPPEIWHVFVLQVSLKPGFGEAVASVP
jgi:hypothetical protein